MQTAKVEVFVLVDEAGDHVASHDQTQLRELYEDRVQAMDGSFGVRVIKIELTVPLPVTSVVQAVIPADDTTPTVTVS